MCQRLLSLLAYCLLLTVVSGCSSLSKTEYKDPRPAAEDYVRGGDLERLVSNLATPLIARAETPGMVVAVLLPDGSKHFYGYGTAEAGKLIPPTSETVFPVGSLTKSMIGGLLELEIDRGSPSWDDTLA